MPLDRPFNITPADINYVPNGNKLQNWERNTRVAHAICQGKQPAGVCAEAISLFYNKPMVLVEAVKPVVEVYKTICHTYDEQGTERYNNEVVRKFRNALPDMFKPMTKELITEIYVDQSDALEIRTALDSVVAFSTNGRGQTAQSKADAAESANEIETLVNNGVYFAPQLASTFLVKKGDRIQAAVNYWSRTPGKQYLVAKLNALMPAGKTYIPAAGNANAARRNPNSRNVDYLLNSALFLNHLSMQIVAPNGESMETYLPRYLLAMKPAMSSKIGKGDISVSMYTGLGEAVIPKGADPRTIGPQAMTGKRLRNSLIPFFMPYTKEGYEMDPECFSRLEYHPATLLAICKVINMCEVASSEYNSNMTTFSRLIRNQMLNKMVYNCPNFMEFDPFKVKIVNIGRKGAPTNTNYNPNLYGASSGGPARLNLSALLANSPPRKPNQSDLDNAQRLVSNAPQSDSPENRMMWWGLANGDGFDGTHIIPSGNNVRPSMDVVNKWFDARYKVHKPVVPQPGYTEVDVYDSKGSYTMMVSSRLLARNDFMLDGELWSKDDNGKWVKTRDSTAIGFFMDEHDESGAEA